MKILEQTVSRREGELAVGFAVKGVTVDGSGVATGTHLTWEMEDWCASLSGY